MRTGTTINYGTIQLCISMEITVRTRSEDRNVKQCSFTCATNLKFFKASIYCLIEFLDLKPNSPEKWKLNRNSKLFYLYGHSYEFEDNNNWEIIEKFCAKASNNEDVWYATSSEICSYINAYNSLVYSLDNSLVYNPTATTIYAEFYRKNYVIKPNETVKIEVLPY